MTSASTAAHPIGDKNMPGAPGTVPLRQRLRVATSDAHARLDGLLVGVDLRQRADYCRFLEASAAALLPLEAALSQSGVERLFPDWPARARSGAIGADLDRLGGTIDCLPTPARLSADGVLGAMYVLEGSRLGAVILLAQVAKSSDPAVRAATAYLRHGTGKSLWPSFLATLDRHGASMGDESAAVSAARQAFALFAEAMSGLPARRSLVAERVA